jgi:hypothetical protein
MTDADVGPAAHADGCDDLRPGYEVAPSVAGGVDDVVEGFEDGVRQPIGAQILPD